MKPGTLSAVERTKRVLIIEDDGAVRAALKKVLDGAGYVAATAAAGPEGLDRLRAAPFDLLVLDLNLPVLSGWDVLDLVRTELPSLPVLILTGELRHCEPGALAGVDAVLEKPCEAALLLQTLERLLTEPAGTRLQRVCRSLEGTPPIPGAAVSHFARLLNLTDQRPG